MEQSTEELLDELFGDPTAKPAPVQQAIAVEPAPRAEAEHVQLQLDAQVLTAFRAAGGDWQQRINVALNTWLRDNDPKQMRGASH